MTTPHLDPELAHLAELDVGFGHDSIDLHAIRSALVELTQPPPLLAGVSSQRSVIREDPPAAIEIYSSTETSNRPCLIWFHGGGFMIGSAGMDAPRLQQGAAHSH